jgi:hypothetical protein
MMYKLVLPNRSGLVLQPAMGPAVGSMAGWTSLFFPIGERSNPPAYYGPSSRTDGLLDKLVTNGLLDKLVLPAVWSSSPLWVQQLDHWPAGQACSSKLGAA